MRLLNLAGKFYNKQFAFGELNRAPDLVCKKSSLPLLYQKNHFGTHKEIRIAGYPINFIKIGSGKCVVFCFPGVMGAMNIQIPNQIKGFNSDKFTFISWDQPGYAKSSPPVRQVNDNSILEDTEIMLELMEILGYDKFSVMGWSGGGISCMLAAVKRPEIIQKLVIWGAFASVDEKDAENFLWYSNVDQWGGIMKKTLIEEFGNELFVKHFGDWMKVFARVYSHHNGQLCSHLLGKIVCPTLILHGTEDGLVYPKHGRLLHENIKGSRLIEWKNGKHNIHLRYPEEFNNIVQEFLLQE